MRFAVSYTWLSVASTGKHAVSNMSCLGIVPYVQHPGSMEYSHKYCGEFGQIPNDADVSSFSYISGFRIGGRQFFPCEIISNTNQVLQTALTVTVREADIFSGIRENCVLQYSNLQCTEISECALHITHFIGIY